jgi:CarD family transcriptional regulator
MAFKVGEYAVYPLHGVGVIQDISDREIGGLTQEMYVLNILENGMRVMVPVASAEAVGLRKLIPTAGVKDVYEVLATEGKRTDNQTWNRRYRDYMGKIKTGDLRDVAEVLRDLALIKRDKNLSFGERKMFDTAWSLIVREVALARNQSNEAIGEEIESLFAGDGDHILAAFSKVRRPAKSKVAKKKAAAKKKAPAKKPAAKKAASGASRPAKKAAKKKAAAKKKSPAKKKPAPKKKSPATKNAAAKKKSPAPKKAAAKKKPAAKKPAAAKRARKK